MTVLALFNPFFALDRDRPAPNREPKPDWPLMGDIATCRAGVPETLIYWRRARGEDPPQTEVYSQR